MKDCPDCGGGGSVYPSYSGPCGCSGGSGCTSCGGSGYSNAGRSALGGELETCTTCKGSGKVPDD